MLIQLTGSLEEEGYWKEYPLILKNIFRIRNQGKSWWLRINGVV